MGEMRFVGTPSLPPARGCCPVSVGGAPGRPHALPPRMLCPTGENRPWSDIGCILDYNPLRDPGNPIGYRQSGWKSFDGNEPRPWKARIARAH